jgi:hypothetical protein
MVLYYHPAGYDVLMVVYHLLYELLVFFVVEVGGLGWWAGRGSRVHSIISGVSWLFLPHTHISPDDHL